MTTFLMRMREELARRNYAESTIRSYLRIVEEFRQYAGKRLDYLGPDDIRRYQAHLLEKRSLSLLIGRRRMRRLTLVNGATGTWPDP